MNRRPGSAPRPQAGGSVRVIGGRWRGTRLSVVDMPGLRPSSDRVRETLFNWLAPVLPGARCIDLFAGSGALGIEAASRGAAEVLMIERDPRLAAQLQASLQRLAATQVDLRVADAIRLLDGEPDRPFDIAFVDPPFDAGLWPAVFERLPRWLAADAWIYVEAPLGEPLQVPPSWQLHREGQTREVRYALYRRHG